MSFFSKLKIAKRAAKTHKEAEHQQHDKAEEAAHAKIPYRHVPTHAAFDALSGAPSSWKQDDRPLIKEQHKRRSQMISSRTGSYMSTAHNSGTQLSMTEEPPLNRNSSYSSYNPTWRDRGDRAFLEQPVAARTSKPSRNGSYIDSSVGPSPLISNFTSQKVSPLQSSATSASSVTTSSHLEMKTSSSNDGGRSQPVVYEEQNIFNRLHTSTNRKVGETPVGEYRVAKARQSTAPAVAAVANHGDADDAPQKKRMGIRIFKGKAREVAITA